MKIVAFDFDGTLSDSEMTVLLGERKGVADQMEDITARAMNDEISYAKSLRDRAALLEGLPLSDAEDAFADVRLRPGAAEILSDLSEKGTHVAILTGGFERGVLAALDREGVSVDTIIANRLPDDGEALTGEVEGPLIEGTKDEALESLAEEHDADMVNTVAVGDGANDLPMLEVAGLAVGFDPKPAVAPACDTIVSHMNELHDILKTKNAI
ncbi:phosphoserine phosphatase [Haladaptatus litoreus]|uniref:phosphoserine phosphatase n=1 Tax=Haladaptatus litoreus TaxID=553468 RepID=A0A1N7BGV1_9EURY|nr:phosphoserine phosphatase SerB [Haladaptatus litoreus]SIR50560.1 phosphoserine phosphatase [Haladaptatus litoreus]